jgi:hypothetical protein
MVALADSWPNLLLWQLAIQDPSQDSSKIRARGFVPEGDDARAPSGVWELIVQIPRDAATGRAKQLRRTIRGTKGEAQRALAALVTEVTTTPVSTTTTVNLAELLDRWLDAAAGGLSPTTAHEHRRLSGVLIEPALGRVAIRRLTAHRLDEFCAALGRERGCRHPGVGRVGDRRALHGCR